jgi:hypothetical protein
VVKTYDHRDHNVGVIADSLILRLSQNNPCSAVVTSSFANGQGIRFEPVSDSTFQWTGGFILIRPAGQTSLDPRIPDQVASLFLLDGTITFQGSKFKVLSYTGKDPVDICAALS